MALVVDHPTSTPSSARPSGSAGLPGISNRRDGAEPVVRCRRCGAAIPTGTDHVISSHRTSTGRVTYLRCECDGVGIWILDSRAA